MNGVMSRLWLWAPPVLYLGLVYGLSTVPTIPTVGIYGLDKLLHVIEYTVLGLLLSRAAGWPRSLSTGLLLVAIGVGAGAVDEWIQSHTPGRESTIGDAIADSIGVLIGVQLGSWFRRRRVARPPA